MEDRDAFAARLKQKDKEATNNRGGQSKQALEQAKLRLEQSKVKHDLNIFV